MRMSAARRGLKTVSFACLIAINPGYDSSWLLERWIHNELQSELHAIAWQISLIILNLITPPLITAYNLEPWECCEAARLRLSPAHRWRLVGAGYYWIEASQCCHWHWWSYQQSIYYSWHTPATSHHNKQHSLGLAALLLLGLATV